jgi:hypothetical protein
VRPEGSGLAGAGDDPGPARTAASFEADRFVTDLSDQDALNRV